MAVVKYYNPNGVTGAEYPVAGCLPYEDDLVDYAFTSALLSTTIAIQDRVSPGVALADPTRLPLSSSVWIYDGSEIRRVVQTMYGTDPELTLYVKIDRPFSAATVNGDLKVTYKGFAEWSISNIGGAAGIVNGASFAAGSNYTRNQESITVADKQEPCCYDATGTTFEISVTTA